ncbi:MAG: hypothetical protein AB1488_08795, partial [Nitrospirota bacterium]
MAGFLIKVILYCNGKGVNMLKSVFIIILIFSSSCGTLSMSSREEMLEKKKSIEMLESGAMFTNLKEEKRSIEKALTIAEDSKATMTFAKDNYQ